MQFAKFLFNSEIDGFLHIATVFHFHDGHPYFARNWVTVKDEGEEIKGVHCNVCLGFASSESAFTSGFTKFSQIYERLADHEASKSHIAAVAALVHAEAARDIEI